MNIDDISNAAVTVNRPVSSLRVLSIYSSTPLMAQNTVIQVMASSRRSLTQVTSIYSIGNL